MLVRASRRERRRTPGPGGTTLRHGEVVDGLGRRDGHLLRLAEHGRRPTGPVHRLHERGRRKACWWADGTLLLEMRQWVVELRGAADWDVAD
jgi:hypothetical protein